MKTGKHTFLYRAAPLFLAVAIAMFAAPLFAADGDAVAGGSGVQKTTADDEKPKAEDITVRDLVRRYFKDGGGEQLAQVLGWKGEAKQVIALDYTILMWDPEKKAETAVRNPGDHQFNIGDSIRVTIEPLTDAYIYIFHRGASGKTSFLLPAEGEEPPLVKAGQTLALPEDGYMEFVDPPGEEELLVIAAKEKADLATLMKILNQSPDKDTAAESSQRKGLNIISKKMRQRNNKKLRHKLSLADRSLDTTGESKAGKKEVHNWLADRAVITERPGGKTDATLAVVASNRNDKHLKMLVSIPLTSVEKK